MMSFWQIFNASIAPLASIWLSLEIRSRISWQHTSMTFLQLPEWSSSMSFLWFSYCCWCEWWVIFCAGSMTHCACITDEWWCGDGTSWSSLCFTTTVYIRNAIVGDTEDSTTIVDVAVVSESTAPLATARIPASRSRCSSTNIVGMYGKRYCM